MRGYAMRCPREGGASVGVLLLTLKSRGRPGIWAIPMIYVEVSDKMSGSTSATAERFAWNVPVNERAHRR